ncbi:MAG: hypothetical protein NWR70_09515 [Algoriphagus sp.]|jgi:uncharacterized membrane protein|nr:hypothetical protein [Algoriphagus sp.]
MSLPPHHILSVDLRMHEAFLTFVGIYLVTMFKFVAGPLLGTAAGYSPWKIIGVSVLGMMSSVTLFTFFGKQIKKWIYLTYGKQKKLFTKKNRRIVNVWNSYGELGIAFLTPILLTPIVGTLILVSFGSAKRKIFSYMLISSLAWAIFFSFSIEWLLSIPIIAALFR